jgi:hypothetical protein
MAEAAGGMKLLPQVFRRITNPVEPFCFQFGSNSLPPPLPQKMRDGLRQPAEPLDPFAETAANVL